MAWEKPISFNGQLCADIDMSNEANFQFHAVNVGPAVNTVGAPNGGAALLQGGGASGTVLGVLQNAPQQGIPGNVMDAGVSMAYAGGTFNAGDYLTVNAAGQYIKATAGTAIYGRALESGITGSIGAIQILTSIQNPAS